VVESNKKNDFFDEITGFFMGGFALRTGYTTCDDSGVPRFPVS
jgi:hypothetical protein